MKKTWFLAALACALVIGFTHPVQAAPAGGGFQQAPAAATAPGGGFSGPGLSPSTVEQAKQMRDDAPVVLRGNIVQSLGKEMYLFRDATGSIRVEIDDDKWSGQTITPQDTVELHGEVDKDWNSVEIDVDRVVKITAQ